MLSNTNGFLVHSHSRFPERLVEIINQGFHGHCQVIFIWPEQPDPGRSGSHLAGIVSPEAERISPCMTIGVGGEAIAAWFEDGVDLVMGGEELLCLPG